MSTTPLPKSLPPPTVPSFTAVVDPKTGNIMRIVPTKEYAQYLQSLDDAVRTLCAKI